MPARGVCGGCEVGFGEAASAWCYGGAVGAGEPGAEGLQHTGATVGGGDASDGQHDPRGALGQRVQQGLAEAAGGGAQGAGGPREVCPGRRSPRP